MRDACTIADTLICDQIVIGTTDDEIRAKGLSEQWGLTDLVTKGRQMEAASLGAVKIKEEVKQEVSVSRLKPGKYSWKSQKGASAPQCKKLFKQSVQRWQNVHRIWEGLLSVWG